MSTPDFENMSDDELMNMQEPPMEAPVSMDNNESQQDQEESIQEEDDVAEVEESEDDAGSDDSDDNAEDDSGNADDEQPDQSAVSDEDLQAGSNDKKPTEDKNKPKVTDKDASKDESKGEQAVDYKAAYDRLMGPIKANGKEIKLNSVDEAITLIQMGANYTKKLQTLQPQLKLLKMLENNGLLAEDKLTYLIDLDKKNPEAIHKLLRDGGVDPMDIDTSVEPKYTPGNHQVSDLQFQFDTVLEEVTSTDTGKALVLKIHKDWDQASKKLIGENPEALKVLNQHRESGIFDEITNEVERRKTLGQLKDVPDLHAYYQVGQELQTQKGQTSDAAVQQQQEQPAPKVLATRVATRKADVNGDKARAAAPFRTEPKKAQPEINPLSMSDEEFEKIASLAPRL